jgi:hypothetical protein
VTNDSALYEIPTPIEPPLVLRGVHFPLGSVTFS